MIGAYVSPVVRTLPGNAVRAARDPSRLTVREHEISHFLTQGATDKQIGEALGISHRTVRAHLARLMVKTGVHSRRTLAKWYELRLRARGAAG